MACYHSQQCAEKYLKGYLVAHSISFALHGEEAGPARRAKLTLLR